MNIKLAGFTLSMELWLLYEIKNSLDSEKRLYLILKSS